MKKKLTALQFKVILKYFSNIQGPMTTIEYNICIDAMKIFLSI